MVLVEQQGLLKALGGCLKIAQFPREFNNGSEHRTGTSANTQEVTLQIKVSSATRCLDVGGPLLTFPFYSSVALDTSHLVYFFSVLPDYRITTEFWKFFGEN